MNNLQLDPMYLDVAGGPISTGITANIFKSIEWINPTNPGDKAILIDSLGSIVCSFVCVVAGLGGSRWFGDKGQIFQGPFTLTQLDSGALLIARV